jgi:hypothetical protein
MTIPKQARANRANARRSTGPRTRAGKARSSRNSLKHGMRAEATLVPGESPEQWREHREGVLIALGAKGALETELADRVALALWRLRRIAVHDAAATARDLDDDGPEPDGGLLAKVIRYESHVSRQMIQALNALERLQILRDRMPALAAFAVDDTLDLFDRQHQARLEAHRRVDDLAADRP